MGSGNFLSVLFIHLCFRARLPLSVPAYRWSFFGWGLSVADSCCQHQLWKPLLLLSFRWVLYVNTGLGGPVEASVVNYRMFVLSEVWLTWFAKPLWTLKDMLCLYSPIIPLGRHTCNSICNVNCVWKIEDRKYKPSLSNCEVLMIWE